MNKKFGLLDNRHWLKKDFVQRMVWSDWQQVLLNHYDKVTFEGKLYQLVAKKLGCGIMEVSKISLEERKK